MSTRDRVSKALTGLTMAVSLATSARADYVPSDPMRFTAWNPGLNAVGGIPASRPQCGTTLVPLGGGQDDSAVIQAALNACPVGQVVQLAAGSFTVNSYVLINKGITLRGAGPGLTRLQKTNGATMGSDQVPDAEPLVIVGPSRWPRSDSTTSQNLTVNGPKGAMSVTVANGAGFAAGQFVLLDELSGASWQPDWEGQGQVWASPDYRVVWQLHNPPWEYVDDPLNATTPTSGDAASWFCRQDRPTNEIKEVASVAGNVLTFTTPLHIDYRTSHAGQLTRYTANGNGGNGGVHVTYAGVEDLTLSGGSDGALRFMCAAYSWAKNVEVTVWMGEGIAINDSFRCELRHSYVHDGAWPYPGGGGYAISLADASSEILVEDNIFVRANKVMVARCSGAGSVVGYNYADQGFIGYNYAWIESGLNASHMVGPHHVLFEGNYSFNWDSDHTHGNSIYHTVFRNYLRGIRSRFTSALDGQVIDDTSQSDNGPRRTVSPAAYSSWMTFVGNILGAQGQMAGWVYESSGPNAMAVPAIWLLGWESTWPQPGDGGRTAATTIRDGNWDWLQARQSWHNGPPVALQDSLYLSGKPAFFGANPWPWVTPENASNPVSGVLPAKARFDALMGTPSVSIRDGSLTEGNAGSTQVTITITLSAPSASPVAVNYATASPQ